VFKRWLCSLVLVSQAEAQTINIDFSWAPVTNVKIDGYKLYKGDSVDLSKMVAVATIPPESSKYSYPWTDGDNTKCFSISAYNSFGESPKSAKDSAGRAMCVGKPLAPQGLSWSAQLPK